ncbi:MAG: hypothetical protein LBR77_05255 [Lachnospiraceae bacterium]|jgi:hypothetical protein|nr:hypothetical protein [Lachnospiraceae bacterium]
MMAFLLVKERLRLFYSKFYLLVRFLAKFALAFACMYALTHAVGYMQRIKGWPVILGVSAVCALLPYSGAAILLGGVMLAHLQAVSLDVCALMGVFLFAVAVLYYGFSPGDCYLLLLSPLLCALKVPYLLPLIVGMGTNLAGIIPIACGAVVYHMLVYVKASAGVWADMGDMDILERFVQTLGEMLSDRMMFVMVAVLAVGALATFLIKKLSVDYAWVLALAGGLMAQLVALFVGQLQFDIPMDIAQVAVGMLVCALLACVAWLFLFSVDYSRTEYTQFEDDGYYYYVKAVPKIAVSMPDVQVRRLNPGKSGGKAVADAKPAKSGAPVMPGQQRKDAAGTSAGTGQPGGRAVRTGMSGAAGRPGGVAAGDGAQVARQGLEPGGGAARSVVPSAAGRPGGVAAGDGAQAARQGREPGRGAAQVGAPGKTGRSGQASGKVTSIADRQDRAQRRGGASDGRGDL